MKKLFALLCFFSPCKSYECVYPVALPATNKSDMLYVVYQKVHSLELLAWNTETKHLRRVLSKRFLPSQVSLLPNNQGFSFIDQGVVWVQSFAKRSPAHLEIPLPLRHIEYISWKDSSSCYFSALQGQEYALFELDRSSNVDCLLAIKGYDCLYPQKVNNEVFCIVHEKHARTYHLIKSPYSSLAHDHDYTLLYSFAEPAAFLTMVSDTQAFVITIPDQFYPGSDIHYSYALLELTDQAWSLQPLFSFSLPHTAKSKTFELILPFLPRYNQKKKHIVYTSFVEGVYTVYVYDCVTGVSQQLSPNGSDSFAPYFFQDTIIWGGEIKHDESETGGPRMWLAEGRVCLDLPYYLLQ